MTKHIPPHPFSIATVPVKKYGKSAWRPLFNLASSGSNPTLSAIFFASKACQKTKTDASNCIRCMADMYGRKAGAKKKFEKSFGGRLTKRRGRGIVRVISAIADVP